MNKFISIFVGWALLLLPKFSWAHGISEDDKHMMLSGGLPEYIWLGASHMLTGYDHLLFIFGVIFFLTKFKEVIKFITVFTVGHSITLVFATFMEITANYYLVDAVIALTVIYKGFDNIDGFRRYFKVNPPNMLALVFIFGLIHGFGLSTRLQELPLGHDGLLLKILSFNLGVELGQVAALTGMIVVLAGWRKTKSFARFSRGANWALMACGAALFVMQLQSYWHERHHVPEQSGEYIHNMLHGNEVEEHDHSHDGHGHDHGDGHSHDNHAHDHDHGHSHSESHSHDHGHRKHRDHKHEHK